MNAVEATRQLLQEIDEVGEGVSISWNSRSTEVRPTVQGGEVTGLALIPGRVTVDVSFTARPTGIRVEMGASGQDSEACLASAIETLRAHLPLIRGRSCRT